MDLKELLEKELENELECDFDYSFTDYDEDDEDDEDDWDYDNINLGSVHIEISPSEPRKFNISFDYKDRKNLTKTQAINFILKRVKKNLEDELDY